MKQRIIRIAYTLLLYPYSFHMATFAEGTHPNPDAKPYKHIEFNNTDFGSAFSIGVQTLGFKKLSGKPVFNNWGTLTKQNQDNETDFAQNYEYYIKNAPGTQVRFSFAHDMAVEYDEHGYIKRNDAGDIVYDEQEFELMEHIIDTCHQYGKKIYLCLFHFSWPTGKDNHEFKNGFADDQYTQEWVRFARKAVDRFGSKIDIWMLFNEPTGYVSDAYLEKKYPPYLDNPSMGGNALVNIKKAEYEIRAYIHQQFPGSSVTVGTQEQARLLFPARWWNPFDHLTAYIGNHLSLYATLEYYKTGILSWGIMPALFSSLNWTKKFKLGRAFFKLISSGYLDMSQQRKETPLLDFAAVSYYTCGQMRGTHYEPMSGYPISDDGNAIYPDGLSHALAIFNTLVQTDSVNIIKIGEIGYDLNPEQYDATFIQDTYEHLLYLAYMYNQEHPEHPLSAIHFWSTFNIYEWPLPGKNTRFSYFGMIEKIKQGILTAVDYLINHGHYPPKTIEP